MKSKFLQAATAALVCATLAAPAAAGGWHGRYHGHRHHYHGSSAGWWVGGTFALLGAGALFAATTRPSYGGPAIVYTAPAVVYAPPVAYSPPVVYAQPPVVYGAPAPQYNAPAQPEHAARPAQPGYGPPAPRAPQDQLAAPSPRTKADPTRESRLAANTAYECQRWAMNQSGFDPSYVTRWTTGASVDSYNRAFQSCMNGGRGG